MVEEAERALTTVDSEFGRTTDPVRMYMREMGSVELLTREGEIVIAKKIEDGLRHMIMAISACPTTIAEMLQLADKVNRDEMRIDELIDGLVNPHAAEEVAAEPPEEDEAAIEVEESEEDEEGAASAAHVASMLVLKGEALEKFKTIQQIFIKMMKMLEKKSTEDRAYKKLQSQISDELMGIRFTAKQIESLCDSVRRLVEEVRTYERGILDLCVKKCGMPRPHFIKSFPGHEVDLEWLAGEMRARKPYVEMLARHKHDIVDNQNKLMALQERVGLPIKEIKEIARQMSTGEAKARRAKREMIEANLRLVISIAKKYTNRGFH